MQVGKMTRKFVDDVWRQLAPLTIRALADQGSPFA
jgi:hypothetical protein